MRYKINRLIEDNENSQYPVDLTLFSDEEWVAFAHDVMELTGYLEKMDENQDALTHVKFSKPSEKDAASLIANLTMRFSLTDGRLIDLKYAFDAEKEIYSKQHSQLSMLWRKKLLFSPILREKYMQYWDDKRYKEFVI